VKGGLSIANRLSFARERVGGTPRVASTEVPATPKPAETPSREPGVLRRRIEVPLAGGREASAQGRALLDIGSVAIPDAGQLARALAAVGVVPRDGLPAERPAVLFDLETTGLSRDSGCVAFMVGMAWHEGTGPAARLVVEQWILSRLSSEAAMLRDVSRTLTGPDLAGAALVTFNGASFDVPLLRTRLVRHRLARPGQPTALDGRPHYDLLVAARRLWKGRGPDCRLSTLERLHLSVHRQGDVAGSEIADAYWAWLRAPTDPRACDVLERIAAHNRVDLVSLAGLAGQIGDRLTDPRHLADVLRAADHHARQQRAERALAILEPAIQRWRTEPAVADPVERGLIREAALLTGELLRKTGQHPRAAEVWALVCQRSPGEPSAHESLAKHLEHKRRDPAAALSVASRSASPCPRRIARLQRKVDASGADPVPFEAALARAAPIDSRSRLLV